MNEIARLTYALEKRRAVVAGIVDTAFVTFLMLVAVRDLNASGFQKGALASASGLGYLAAPLLVAVASQSKAAVSRLLAGGWFLASLLFLLPAFFPWIWVYIICGVAASVSLVALVPFSTHLYQLNYPSEFRGKLFSRGNLIRVLSASAFGWFAGFLLERNLLHWRLLLVVYSVAACIAAALLVRLPAGPFESSAQANPLRSFRHLRSDKFFASTLVYWMVMGFGVLMMLPFRVEFLANPIHGHGLPEDQVALLVAVIPNLGRILGNPLWGGVWNRLNLFQIRLLIDGLFILGILGFFGAAAWWALAVSAFVLGLSMSGAEISWTLWVTKFAPDHLIAEYMGVHLFFTGIRAMLGPLLTFVVAEHVPAYSLMWISVGLIAIANIIVLRESQKYAPEEAEQRRS